MCFVDDSLTRSMKNKSSIGEADDVDRNIDTNDEDFDRRSAVLPPPSSQLPSHSHTAWDESEERSLARDGRMGETPLSMQNGHRNSTYKNNRTINSSRTVETILPNVIWLEHILPCLDRSSWNALMEASKPIYMLAMISKLTAEYQGRTSADASTSTAQPPWPTNRSFQSKSGGQGQAIESIAMSHDGEFIACGSVIGSIDIWNLRTGKIQWKAKQTTSTNQTQYATSSYETAEELAQYPNYFASSNNASRGGRASAPQSSSSLMQRRSAPLGSVLRFSQGGGYTLACGFENRVFVWDLEKELRRKHPQMNRIDRHHQEMTTEATPSLPLHKQHHIFVPLSRRKQSEEQERRRQRAQDHNDLCYQTLEIKCNHGTIYEVTYLGFSNTFGNPNNGPHRLVARYGKTAYIWTTASPDSSAGGTSSAGESSPRYVLTHSIPLSSSRCQMVSNLSLTKLAVATNGGSSRRNNARQNEEESLTSSSNNKVVDGKGIIHVWDLEDALTRRDQSYRTQNECQHVESVSKISSNCSTRIVAYPNHVVRGLEFLQLNTTNGIAPTASTLSRNTRGDSDGCLLVSASLQGEVKFWKKYTSTQTHPRDRYSNNCSDCLSKDTITANNNCIADEREEPSFVCVYRFQSPGKIFSLASWSSISSLTGEHKILLAAGEARGQVRVWKVSPNFLSTPSSSSASEVSLGPCGKSGGASSSNSTYSKHQRLEECLSTEVGDHVHYDNIKLLGFTPNGKSLAVSRAYDAKIWFQTVWQ